MRSIVVTARQLLLGREDFKLVLIRGSPHLRGVTAIPDLDDLPGLVHALADDHAKAVLLLLLLVLSHSHQLSRAAPLNFLPGRTSVALALMGRACLRGAPYAVIVVPEVVGLADALLARGVLEDHLLQLARLLIKVLDEPGLLEVRHLRAPVADCAG